MFCKKCGKELPVTVVFCDGCGEKVEETKKPASVMKRLSNYIIDYFVGIILMIIVAVIATFAHSSFLTFFAYIVYFVYYIVCEALWQKTLGKVITKTKVVDLNGEKPKFLRIVGRSLARFIPFEVFSYVFSSFPVGWHDSLSKTLVVPNDYTPEDVKSMNLVEIKKVKAAHPVAVIGIIIMVVLAVIAIVGILASIVLASLNSAREKAEAAKIQQGYVETLPTEY